ncbi:MAG: tyrosine-protein phosphatase [Thermoplasmata archaeon]
MNRELQSVIKKIKDLGMMSSDISGIVTYGSLGRKQEDYFSDGDFMVYLLDRSNYSTVKMQIIDVLKNIGYKDILDFHRSNKWIIFAYKSDINYLMKLEIMFSDKTHIKDEIIFVIQSRIDKIEDAILVDKDNIIEEYKKYWFSIRDKVQNEFYDILNSFVYYYDEFLNRFTKGDIFRAQMNYTTSFYKLVSMVALSYGEYRDLYQPWFLTRDIIKKEDTIKLNNLLVKIDPKDLFNKKFKLITIFFEYAQKAAEKFKIEFDLKMYKNFITQIDEKYYEYFNFRDIAKIINFCSPETKVRRGVIFRSASLSRYNKKTILSIIKSKNIWRVVDLRDLDEIKKCQKQKGRGYMDYLGRYICSIPIKSKVKENFNLYYAILINEKRTIGKIFNENISLTNGKKSIIIHCEGGKDRTGIIIALLLDAIGIDRECIIEDYMHSFSDTRRDNIEFLFKIIDEEFKGTINYLVNECKVNKEVINNIKSNLLITSN